MIPRSAAAAWAALAAILLFIGVPQVMTQAMPDDLTTLSADDLAERLEAFNEAYRSGTPLISDAEYDALVEHLRTVAPDHPYLKSVEPEVFPAKRQVRHPVPMLSTEKAYVVEGLRQFVARVHKKAVDLGGIGAVEFRVTPKLDGLAGRDDGQVLASRGDGLFGYDITNAFDKGVVAVGGRGEGLGEIVVCLSYFEDHLDDAFEHPRNLVVGIVSSDTVNEAARQALADGAVRFVPYRSLPDWVGSGEALLARVEDLYTELTAVDYPTDGLIVEATDARLREALGATSHHYRWQIAYKRRGDTAATQVAAVIWQVGRTGVLTPVMEVEPVSLSGATIRRVTAHNAERVEKDGIGPGARIEIIRSGEVIPKIERVLTPSDAVALPRHCPSCGTPLERDGPFLRCPNSAGCRDQLVQRIHHWFHTIGNADWFGIKTVERLVDQGCQGLTEIYDLALEDYQAMGFGPGQATNLAEAVQLSRTQRLEDWRFLAAFGLPHLGTGDSRRLLQVIPLEFLFDVRADQIARIYGFAERTSGDIAAEIAAQAHQIAAMWQRGFNLERTAPVAVDFLVSLGICEDVANEGGAKSKKEKLARQQALAAALLRRWPLADIGGITAAQILDLPVGKDVKPFAAQICEKAARHQALLQRAASLDLDWRHPPVGPPGAASALAGRRIVFTGKMTGGSREEMQDEARRLGAEVQTAVGPTTDYLVCGEKVGAVKTAKARALGVAIIDEAAYRQMLEAHNKGEGD
ncbi:MAG: BRCT domain-containing protein [Desulfobacteraceae bacterium]|jgi:DNA ligase (NAD+)|nr:BRCT domain-containing protein [Desulfobacteraceae bacterium]